MSCRAKQFSFAALLALVSALTCGAYDGAANFNDRVSLTIKGQGSAMSNFPLLVRLSSTQLPGFSYDRANIDELAFVDSDGTTALSYDVDTWNTSGESLVWVKLPELPTGGKTITMYWSLKSGGSAPPNNPSDVWSEYAGVWHMSDTTDASGNNAKAKLGAQSAVSGGMFGNAIKGTADGESLLLVDAGEKLDGVVNDTFSVTFWTYLNGTSNGSSVQYLFSRRKTWGGDSGYSVYLSSRAPTSAAQSFGVSYGEQAQNFTKTLSAGDIVVNGWMRHDIVFSKSNSRYYWYVNGNERYWSNTIGNPPWSNGTAGKLAIGGRVVLDDDETKDSNLNGAMDEFRIRSGQMTQARINAETANLAQTSYVEAVQGTSFIVPSVVTSDGVTYDYWVEQPYITPASWVIGEFSSSAFSISKGKLRGGLSANKFWVVNSNDASERWNITNEALIPATLANLPEGEYTLYCDNTTVKTEPAAVKFAVNFKPSDIYSDHVTFTLNGIGSTPVKNYTLLLRISESALPGFSYSRVGGNNQLLAFTDGYGNKLHYDIDKWNTSGESLVWVNVPSAADGTTVTMHWCLKSGKTAPVNVPANTWEGYAGVWHMSNDSTADATGHSADGQSHIYSANVSGMFGEAFWRQGTGPCGPIMTIPASDEMNALTNGSFTVSGWVKLNSLNTNWGYLFSRKEVDSTPAWGVQFYDTAAQLRTFADGSASNCKYFTTPFVSNEWSHVAVVYTANSVRMFLNGSDLGTQAAIRPQSWTNDFYIGGMLTDNPDLPAAQLGGKTSTLDGAMDEVRLMSGEASAERVLAEYRTALEKDYLTATAASPVCPSVVTTASGAKVDYWVEKPSLSAASWIYGDDMSGFTINNGRLRSGAVGTAYYCEKIGGGWSTSDVTASVLAKRPAGSYRVYFRSSGSTASVLGEDPTFEFRVVGSMDEVFEDKVELTLNSQGLGTFTNFPVLVRISESSLPGFSYARALSNELAFVTGDNTLLAYDVDLWDASGESLVWVNIPVLSKNTKVRMFWSRRDGMIAPTYNPSLVWPDYAGVWHMKDTKDSSGHSADGTTSTRSDAVTVSDGVFGVAQGRRTTGTKGPIMSVPASDEMNALSDGAFTVSAWVRLKSLSTGWAYLFSRKEINSTAAWGAQFYGGSDGTSSSVDIYADGSNKKNFATAFKADEWTHVTVIYGIDTVEMLLNGKSLGVETDAVKPTYTAGYGFYIGGMATDDDGSAGGRTSTLNGDMDEVRLLKGAISADRLAVEFTNVLQKTAYRDALLGSDFVVPGNVLTQDGTVTNDYWIVKPTLSKDSWKIDAFDPNTVFGNGVLRSGRQADKFWAVNLDTLARTEITNSVLSYLAQAPEGRHRLYCDSTVTTTEPTYVDFSVNFDGDTLFEDHVTFTLNGIGDTPVYNYTLLVRLSEEQLPGFSYSRAGDGTRHAFSNERGEKLYYDVDVWDSYGESLVWVNVPVATNGTQVTMHWGLKDGKKAPDNNKSKVWDSYAGVWHMSDAKDSTANGAVGTVGSVAYQRTGLFGKALAAREDGEPILLVDANDAIDGLVDGDFTLSFWTYLNSKSSSSSSQYLFSRRTDFTSDTGYALFLASRAPANGSSNVGVACGDTNYRWQNLGKVSGLVVDGWMRNDIVFSQSDKKLYWYVNGRCEDGVSGLLKSISATGLSFNNGTVGQIAIGGRPPYGSTTNSNINGSIDEFRMRAGGLEPARYAAEYSNATLTDYRSATTNSFLMPSVVTREGVEVDYWLSEPRMTPSNWEFDPSAPPAVVYTPGELRSGASVTNWCVNNITGWITDDISSAALAALPEGSYRIYCRTEGSAEIADGFVDFTVTRKTGIDSVGGTVGGRILLMNNDWTHGGDETAPQIDYQGWAFNTNVENFASMPAFWQHVTESVAEMNSVIYNVKSSCESILWTSDFGARLWHLVSCRHGNTFCNPNYEYHTATNAAGLYPNQNYLPYSGKSASIDSVVNTATSRIGAGQILMQNTSDATVYSSCYEEGIGTIYFDAVNGWNDNIDTYIGGTNAYRLVVEVATTNEYGEVATDENIWDTRPYGDNGELSTNYYYKLGINDSCWHACTSYVVRVSGGAIVTPPSIVAGDIELAVTNGGTMAEFYRIYVPLDIRGPARFRIRRTSTDSSEDADEDSQAYILLDNIVVSHPRMRAELTPAGVYDDSKRGREVLGQEGAFNIKFPVVGDRLYAHAVPEYYVNSAVSLTETNFFASARMHYRWRYLEQIVNDWSVATLNPTNGFWSSEPLDIPAMVGDVEFWFDSVIQAPYYRYKDYSGLGMEDAFAAIYSENEPVVKNAAKLPQGKSYPSGGTNWFVRLREGASDFEGIRLFTQNPDGSNSATNVMFLTGDGKWRGYVQTPEEVAEGLDFRFEGVKLNIGDDGSCTLTTNRWTSMLPLTNSLPAAAGVEQSDGWAKAMCDAKTGYLVFTYDEIGETVGVCRGDYQDFNLWSSAVNTNGLFVGSSLDTNTISYATSETTANISAWSLSVATNINWSQDFSVSSGMVASVVYPRDEPFTKYRDGNGWTVEHASWTYQQWASDFATGGFGGQTAVQLEGRGKGQISFISDNSFPDGLDSIKFKARVAQFNEFNDFALYNSGFVDEDGDVVEARDYLSNYTFATFGALTLDKVNDNYHGDGSLSLIAYYHPDYGAYEVRVSRTGNKGDYLRFVLCKWHVSENGMDCEILGTNDFTTVKVDGGLLREKGSLGNLCGIYISVQEYTAGDVTGTMIHAGVSREALRTAGNISASSFSSVHFDNNVFFDTSDTRLTKGTFGVLARNCPGAFIKPVLINKGIDGIADLGLSHYTVPNKLNRYTNSTVKFRGANVEKTYPVTGSTAADTAAKLDKYYKRWTRSPGRTQYFTSNLKYWGFTGTTNATQKLAVQVAKHGTDNWTTITNVSVVGFCDQTFNCAVHRSEQCDVRLQVHGKMTDNRMDVTVDDIVLTQWNGQWTKGYDSSEAEGCPDDYVYTSAWITQDADEFATKVVRLQPARSTSSSVPVSIRSPILQGSGVFHVDWRNADTDNALFLVQRYKGRKSTVESTLAAVTAYSPDSKSWETVETLDFRPGGRYHETPDGGETFFYNDRYDSDEKIVTIYRLVADSSVVSNALSGRVAYDDPNHGMIEVVGSYSWDLPPYDDRSWSGWNFRAEGWRGSKPSMWANISDATTGLSGLLNNTVDSDTLALPDNSEAYRGHPPHIQSPTFATNCIGSVEFRARLYDPVADATAGYPAVVTIYGAKKSDIDPETGEPKVWTEIADVAVSNVVYELKTAKFKSGDQYCVLRFAVKGVKHVNNKGTPVYDPPLRVAIDDICVIEQPVPSIRFKRMFVRPFRDSAAIKSTGPVFDIDKSVEQPIIGEQFGFQAEIELNDIDNEIVTDDPSQPIRVFLSYYPYKEPWGWQNWETNSAAVCDIELVPADGTNLIFRSSLSANALCPPQFLGGDPSLVGAKYRLVQYHLRATFYDKSGEHHAGTDAHNLSSDEWSMPSWNKGFSDPNSEAGYGFSAFTLLEELAPKQAWINEVSLTESTKRESTANQWLELAVPSGVDMTGWSVRLYGNEEDEPFIGNLFTLGRNGAKSSASNATPDSGRYSFYVAKSPSTELAGADATWAKINKTGVNGGELAWNKPFGFELVRPTGIVEHQVVIQGRNQYEEYEMWVSAVRASGTNLVRVLQENIGGDWVWGEVDRYEFSLATAGVTNNMGGTHADWCSPMGGTPGAINDGQIIDPDTFIAPNGGYVWIYSNLSGGHVRQDFGGGFTNSSIAVTMTEGGSTNITYEVDRWYQLSCTVDPADRTTLSGPTTLSDGRRRYYLALSSVSNAIEIAAVSEIASEVSAMIPSSGANYTPAIMKWLEKGVTGKSGDPFYGNTLNNAVYRGSDGSHNDTIDLVGMYWLDLDPTRPGWELWGGMGVYGNGVATNYWPAEIPVIRTTSSGIVHTNLQTWVWMMITNTQDSSIAAYPPYRLQGLNNEQSDTFGGVWTSVTFKVMMQLTRGSQWRYMRYFTFGDDSFYPPGTPEAFSALIEVTDPHSRQSPTWEFGWGNYPDIIPWAKWALDDSRAPAGVIRLKKQSTLDN